MERLGDKRVSLRRFVPTWFPLVKSARAVAFPDQIVVLRREGAKEAIFELHSGPIRGQDAGPL
jgi:hypothetical protein